MRAFTCLLVATALLAAPAAFAATTPAEEVAKAERDFDADTAVHGITRGFHTWSEREAIGFRPGPVDIHARLEEKLKTSPEGFDAPSKLRWGPWRIGVSTSGDFAYDIGTWHIDGTPDQGWFFTLWRKQADGTWRWALDMGAGKAGEGEHPDPAKDLIIDPSYYGAPPKEGPDASTIISVIDTQLNMALETDPAKAYAYSSQKDTVFTRAVGAPQSLAEASAAAWKERPTGATWRGTMSWTARSDEMVCIMGETLKEEKVIGHYVRVWRRSGPETADWKLAVDLYQPAQ